MKGEIITRDLIEGIVRTSNAEFLEGTDKKVQSLLSLAIENLSQKIPYINFDNSYLQPMNELLTGGFTDISSFTYFLAIDSSQLELNTIRSDDKWKKLKARVIYAWKNRKPQKKKRRKKDKDLEITQSKPRDFDPSFYNIFSLAEDLQKNMTEYLSQTSIVYLEGKRLRIVGKDDFGTNTQIVIYPVFSNYNIYKFYLDKKRGFLSINNDLRLEHLDEKLEKVGYIYSQMIKVFNVLYSNINKVLPNQLFIESLLYNCPDELFVEDVYQSFVNIINYLSMADVKNFKSIINEDKNIFNDILCGSSALGYKKFLDKLMDMKE